MAALASLGAALIHFAAAHTHWQEWPPSGLFFVSLATFQLIWAQLVLVRTSSAVLAAGVTVNVGAIALWALSRTAGAPFGPRAGEPELVHAADLCALLLEIYVVMGAGWVWYRRRHGESIPAFANTIVLLGAGAVMALASTVGVASGLQHDHHAPSAGQLEDHHDHDHHAPAVSPPVAESVGTPVAPKPPGPPAAEPLRGDRVDTSDRVELSDHGDHPHGH